MLEIFFSLTGLNKVHWDCVCVCVQYLVHDLAQLEGTVCSDYVIGFLFSTILLNSCSMLILDVHRMYQCVYCLRPGREYRSIGLT